MSTDTCLCTKMIPSSAESRLITQSDYTNPDAVPPQIGGCSQKEYNSTLSLLLPPVLSHTLITCSSLPYSLRLFIPQPTLNWLLSSVTSARLMLSNELISRPSWTFPKSPFVPLSIQPSCPYVPLRCPRSIRNINSSPFLASSTPPKPSETPSPQKHLRRRPRHHLLHLPPSRSSPRQHVAG